MKTLKPFFLFLLLFWFLFLGYFFVKPNYLTIVGKTDFLVIQSEDKNLFGWGKKDDGLIKSLNLFASEKNYIPLETFELKTTAQINKNTIKVVSPHCILGTWDGVKILFLKSQFSSQELKKTPLNFQTDFWVLENSTFPDFLPIPKKAILLLSKQKPAKKLQQFAQEKNIPLVSINQTGGFSFSFKEKKWHFKTQK